MKAINNPYEEGVTAARDGLEFWANPYVIFTGSMQSSAHWFAGWCYGKQTKEADQ